MEKNVNVRVPNRLIHELKRLVKDELEFAGGGTAYRQDLETIYDRLDDAEPPPINPHDATMTSNGFTEGGQPTCPFCSAQLSNEMVRVFGIDAYHGEDTYDFGPENQRATVDITCSTCSRRIYRRKHGEDLPPSQSS